MPGPPEPAACRYKARATRLRGRRLGLVRRFLRKILCRSASEGCLETHREALRRIAWSPTSAKEGAELVIEDHRVRTGRRSSAICGASLAYRSQPPTPP